MNHLDLFSGIGGFALAGRWASINTLYFCEKDEFCKKILTKNFPGIPIFPDIKELDIKAFGSNKIDLITGGFPCQPFSQAGNKRGKDDDRFLWPEFFRIISETKPNWVIIENVSGLVSMGLEDMLAQMENESYITQSFIIPASAAFAPHRRDRIWIIANLNSERSIKRFNYWEKRHIQADWVRHMEKIQSEWSQFIPNTWKTFTARNWFAYNANTMRSNNGLPTELDKSRIKALGNSIVPQIVFPIMKMIYEIESENKNEI